MPTDIMSLGSAVYPLILDAWNNYFWWSLGVIAVIAGDAWNFIVLVIIFWIIATRLGG